MNKSTIGSMTAKSGFLNEYKICNKFLNYKNDIEAKHWLKIMGYDYKNIQNIFAATIPVRINLSKAIELGVSEKKYEETIKHKKADIQVRVEIRIDDILYVENLSLKRATTSAGYNQVDKRPVSAYKHMWGFNDSIEKWLKIFTGETLPKNILTGSKLSNIKDKRRMFLSEMSTNISEEIISFFEQNKTLVVSDILRGRGGLTAEWLLVTRKNPDDSLNWILKDINTVCNFFAKGEVKLSPRGSLKIGRVTMQRKGGTPDPTSLQFKINPLELFDD